MGRIIGVYGVIGGLIVAIGMQISIHLVPEGGSTGMVIGYLTMLVSLTTVFLGVKRYRDMEKGGVIGFLPALLVGLCIAGVASLFYVLAWEIYMYQTNYTFIDEYTATLIKRMQGEGKPVAEIAAFAAQMNEMKASYANPAFRMLMTFAEIAPVGLVVAIVSAAVLRNSRILPARAARA